MSNQEKPTQSNGQQSDLLQRLPTFKVPRDLSLGVPKPSKKVFTPNLNVTRKKNKDSPAVPIKDNKKEEKQRKDRKNDRNKNNRNGPNIIRSTTGVFSAGAGKVERHSKRVSYGRDVESSPKLQRPTLTTRNISKIDNGLEELHIRTACDGGAEQIEDFKYTDDLDAPIKLPFDHGCVSVQQRKPQVKPFLVKTEPGKNPEVDVKPSLLDIKEEAIDHTDTEVVNLLQNDQPTVILVKLPDLLPGRGGNLADELKRKVAAGPDASTSTDETQTVKECYLSHLEEGCIGKIRVHLSGKVTLSLGDTMFEVNSNMKSSFHQEIVSVTTDDVSRSAKVVSLGQLKHKLSIVPDWETVFSDIPA